jgi:hypothetical protein
MSYDHQSKAEKLLEELPQIGWNLNTYMLDKQFKLLLLSKISILHINFLFRLFFEIFKV